MQTLSSQVVLQPKSKLAIKILGELKASVDDFCPEEFAELIKQYELDESTLASQATTRK